MWCSCLVDLELVKVLSASSLSRSVSASLLTSNIMETHCCQIFAFFINAVLISLADFVSL